MSKPNVPEGSIRNLTPLYTSPQPAPAFGEVGIKPLMWRGPISAFPTTIWEAKTTFGHYVIEEVSASDSPAYEVRFAGSLVSVKDDVNDAKDAAQTDHEKRVRSSVSTISVDESVDRVLSELRDRRLLNDVDDDLHQEIAIALIKAVWPLTQLRAPDAPVATMAEEIIAADNAAPEAAFNNSGEVVNGGLSYRPAGRAALAQPVEKK